jgi:hypothetical protein
MKDHSTPKPRRGKFPKGVSGNPAGRPPGSRNKATLAMEALFEQDAEQLIQKAKSMALAGDAAAMRLCLDRILPVRRDRLVHLDLPPIQTSDEISTAMTTIFKAIGEGQITPNEGETLANILVAKSNVVMAEEIEGRLAKVERLVLGGEDKQ